MTASQIYQAYHIMPNLKLHMYRVAAVGSVILDHWHGPQVDRHLITQTLQTIKPYLKTLPDYPITDDFAC